LDQNLKPKTFLKKSCCFADGNILVQPGVKSFKRMDQSFGWHKPMLSWAHQNNLEMKLLKAMTKKTSKTPQPHSRMKVNRLVFLVTILWVVTSLLLLLYHASTTHGIQHRSPQREQLALAVSQAAARASFI
jgi:hypothetical protein